MIPWPLWQRRRIADLQAKGMQFEVANRIGKAETAARQRISRCIGWRAARAAELRFIVNGEKIRFFLTGGLAGLTAEQRDRVFNLPNVSPMVTPGPIHP